MEEFSLLYPDGKTPSFKMLGEDDYNDLSLDMVFEHISENDREKKIIRDIMTKIESDPEVIRYRCDVFDDIIRYPGLREKVRDMLDQLDYLKSFEKTFRDDSVSPIWQLVTRLQELDVYVGCISGL